MWSTTRLPRVRALSAWLSPPRRFCSFLLCVPLLYLVRAGGALGRGTDCVLALHCASAFLSGCACSLAPVCLWTDGLIGVGLVGAAGVVLSGIVVALASGLRGSGSR